MTRATALFFLLICLFTGCGSDPSLQETVAELNERCPVVLDEDTRLDAITSEGDHRLTYHFSLVRADRSSIDTAEFRRALWPGLLSNLRVSREMEKLRSDGVIVRYEYIDRHKSHVATFEFTPGHYR